MRGCTASAPAPPAEEAQCCPDQLGSIRVESRVRGGCPFCFQMGFTESLFSVTLSHSSLIVQLHPRLHCLSKEVWERRKFTIFSVTPLYHSTLSTDSFLSLLKHLWDTAAAICLSTILYQDLSYSIVHGSLSPDYSAGR